MDTPVYLDNQATTRVDPRVVEAMLPFFTETFGNSASTGHTFGWAALEALKSARKTVAEAIGAGTKEIVFTSGATESNNLAIRGVAELPRRRGDHLISVTTEHPSVLDPLERLRYQGYDVTLLPVVQSPDPEAGKILSQQVSEVIRDDTVLVSVMLANNEIGVIQPLKEIGLICKERKVLLHTDATQAVGKIPADVQDLQVDLMSFSAHKIHGPKGVGALYVRRKAPYVRMQPLIYGGGHEGGLRSGTSNIPGIIGFARALELCLDEMPGESVRLAGLRDRFVRGLQAGLDGVLLNGPEAASGLRLPGNLNVSFANVDGESLLMSTPDVAASSGSACTSSKPQPSHVLRALGVGADAARGSLRFSLGRFNTAGDVDVAVKAITDSVQRLRKMSSLPLLRADD